MKNIIERLAVVTVMAVCIFLLFLGGTSVKAESENDNNVLNDINNWHWPLELEGIRFTDYFGTRGGSHRGVDMAAPTGTPVMVVNDGEVYFSGYRGSYGNVIMVRHENGIETVYAHLQKKFVQSGQVVSKGEIIGTVGSTGNSTGPHLHFELHNGEWDSSRTNAIDPLQYFDLSMNKQYEKEKQLAYWTLQDRKLMELHHELGVNDMIKKVVVIRKNDTLWDIAQSEKVSVASIMQWNDLKSDLIHPGQELIIYDEEKYEIKVGETMEQIAKKLSMDVVDLVLINGLTDTFLYSSHMLKIK